MDLLSHSVFYSVYQTPEFCNLFNGIPGLSASAFAVADKEEIKALCVVTCQHESGLLNYFSRRAIIYGGPVIRKECDSTYLEFLLKSIQDKFRRKAIYIETRNLHDYSDYMETFTDCNWNYLPYLNYLVDCSDKDTLFQRLGNNRKRQIRKAVSSGVEIKEALNNNEIDEFYLILRNFYKKKVKKPLLPKEFFNQLVRRNLGKILLVWYSNKIIGGIICPILNSSTIYEFYVCGLDEEYKDQHPSVLATWAAMTYANTNNIKVFDFMGAGPRNSSYGVRDFKARFGGQEIESGRFISINNHILYSLGKFYIQIRQKIK
jgi:serine/alanine adding enzyme